MSDKTFVREYMLEKSQKCLTFSQEEEGDVNCVVWDAALVLAKYLEVRNARHPGYLEKRRIIELGAGLGCVGLVAACLGGNVLLTDRPQALPLLTANLVRNEALVKSLGGIASVQSLDWSDEGYQEPADFILVADCIYYKENIKSLVETMIHLSTAETEIILSQEDRSYSDVQKDVWEQFCREASTKFTMAEIPQQNQHALFSSSDIYLITLKRRKTNT